MKKNVSIYLIVIAVIGAGVYLFFQNSSFKSSAKKSAYQLNEKADPQKEPALLPSQRESTAKKDQATIGKDEKKEADPRSEDSEDNTRTVASVPPAKEKNWKKALSKTLARQLRAWNATPEIKRLGNSKIKEGLSARDVEHVLISIDKGQGNVSSYEAYVHPKTGRILKTWNQTRFENREPLALKAKPFRPFP